MHNRLRVRPASKHQSEKVRSLALRYFRLWASTYSLILGLCRIAASVAFAFSDLSKRPTLAAAILLMVAFSMIGDGRIQRVRGAALHVGGVADTISDKVLVLSLVIAGARTETSPRWFLSVILASYAGITVASVIHLFRHHHTPIPDVVAHAFSLAGISGASLLAVGQLSESSALIVASMITGVAFAHLFASFVRALAPRRQRPTLTRKGHPDETCCDVLTTNGACAP